MVEIVYLTPACGTQLSTIERIYYPFVMINYLTKMNNPPRCAKTLFVDSGGSPDSMIAHKGYPTSDLHYLAYVKKVKANYFALRDYPCEPNVLKSLKATVRDHILKTLEHHLKLLEILDKINVEAQPVPVLQGWRIDDYLYCIDLFKEHCLICNCFDYIGIGSVCRRGNIQHIRKIILKIREELPRKIRLHAFGVNLNVLKHFQTWNAVYSFDTTAFDYPSRWKFGERSNESKLEASVRYTLEFLKKVEALRKKFEGQMRLEEVDPDDLHS